VLIGRFIVARRANVPSNPRMAIHVIAGILSCLMLLLISNVLEINRWYELVIAGLFTYISYLACLWIFKEIGRADIEYFLEILDPRQMKGYLVKEIKGKG